MRKVKADADRLGLRTKKRIANDGTQNGGQPFTRGHIWQILTNPLYAGRIRHKGQVHEGQHEAIIDPDRWDAIQDRMQGGAARRREGKPRGATRKTSPSPLTGKLFDETGDRLTPSHSKSKTGARLRYYISRRLVAGSGENKDGWRLPAQELEDLVAHLIDEHLRRPGFVAEAARDLSAGEMGEISNLLGNALESRKPGEIAPLAERIDLAPGEIRIALSRPALAETLGVPVDRVAVDIATARAPFRMRKRGVETKLILNGAARPVDETLITNIASAHAWYGMIKAGRTFAEISAATGISKRRIQQMLDLAFLAPDIVRDVLDGRQPLGFTSDWCLRRELPSDWAEQRRLIATL